MATRRIVPRALYRAIAAAGAGVIPVCGAVQACSQPTFTVADAGFCANNDLPPDCSAKEDLFESDAGVDIETMDAEPADGRMVADAAFGDGSDVETHDVSGDVQALEGGDIDAEDIHDGGHD
jgi:hypothetical protein